MVKTAPHQAIAGGLRNATFEVADATATHLATAGFDGAVTRFSTHHIPAPDRLMRELARVVRPGGRIIVVNHLADEDVDARSWSQEIERLATRLTGRASALTRCGQLANGLAYPSKAKAASSLSWTLMIGLIAGPAALTPRNLPATRSPMRHGQPNASRSPARPATGP
jgi:SAM-dependent methyltransferase